MFRFCFALCVVSALVWNFGCTPSPPGAAPAAQVKGTINIDNKPVPTGELHFGMPGVPPRVIEIKNGTFAGEAPVGKNQVEVFIYAEAAAPSADKHGGTRSKMNTASPKYWGPNTALSATVEANGANDFKFDITSK